MPHTCLLEEFLQREEFNKNKILSLTQWNCRLEKSLQHAGFTSQNDRIAVNKAYEQLQDLQQGFHQAEIARAKIENALNEERQENRLCRESLANEQSRHNETQQQLNCAWNTRRRLDAIASQIQTKVDDEGQRDTYAEYNITDLVIELETKASKIASLESDLRQEKTNSHTQIEEMRHRLTDLSTLHAHETAVAELHKSELEYRLRNEQARPFANLGGPALNRSPKGNRKGKWGRVNVKGDRGSREQAPSPKHARGKASAPAVEPSEVSVKREETDDEVLVSIER